VVRGGEIVRRWRGLKDLVEDAIDHGSRAIEEIHRQAGRWVFDLLEKVPPLAAPARLGRSLQQAVIGRTYGTIRLVNRVVGGIAEIAIDAAERAPRKTSATRPTRPPRP
jgi:hypothetical protein